MAAILPVPIPESPSGPLRHLVDALQDRFFPGAMDTTTARWIAFLLIVLVSVVFGRFGVSLIFARIKRISESRKNPLVMPALEEPTATLVVLAGVVAALTVVPLWETVPHLVRLGEQGALTAVLLWAIAAAGGAVIDNFAVSARERHLHIAAFLPLIKKTVGSFFLVFSILVVLESLGFEVKTFLAGLGIGGLAFALAAQDTIANLFGSFVVVMDQPFYVGEYIRVSTYEGTVEEIGLRSTRLRTAQRTQVVIPNKTVANEVITNFTRMPQRRVDTAVGVAYGNDPAKIEQVLADVRGLLASDPGVHKGQIVVSLADLGDASIRVQILYFTADPDWEAHMAVRRGSTSASCAPSARAAWRSSTRTPVIRMEPAPPAGPA